MNKHNRQQFWFRRHPRTALAVIALLGIGVSLAAAEFTARLFLPQWAPACAERVSFWCYDEVLGWSHRPGQRGRFVHRDFSVDVSINSFGMRDAEYAMERTANRRRMLVLGDSFGWGFGVECRERFSEILENNHPGWEVINASVSGYGTDQQLLYLRESGLSFEPDVVLLLFCGSDFDDNMSRERNWYYKPRFILESGSLRLQNVPVPESTLKQRLDRYFYGKTYILGRVYHYCLVTHREIAGLFSWADEGNGAKEDSGLRGEFAVTCHLVKAMNDLCRQSNADFMIASVPMDEGRRAFLQDLCLNENIPYLSLDESFSEAEDRVTFPHDGHWNPTGHYLAAETIERFLRDQGVF
jgi:hypothetical protein